MDDDINYKEFFKRIINKAGFNECEKIYLKYIDNSPFNLYLLKHDCDTCIRPLMYTDNDIIADPNWAVGESLSFESKDTSYDLYKSIIDQIIDKSMDGYTTYVYENGIFAGNYKMITVWPKNMTIHQMAILLDLSIV